MRYPLLPSCVFRETFESPLSVAQNGGVVTGTPTIGNGLVVVGDNSTLVTFPRSAPTMNKTKLTVHIKFKSGSNVATVTDLLDKWDDSANNQFVATLLSGCFIMYVADSMTDVGLNKASSSDIAVANTEYDLVWVYDGSLAAANRLKLYVNGVLTAVSVTGTIPTSLTRSNIPVTSCGMYGASLSKEGHTMRLLEIFNIAFSQSDVDDIYQQDTITEIDASKSLVHLPLKSWYWKENGTQMLTSPNVAASWTVGSSTITEDDGGVKITGPQYSYGSQAISLVSGKRYKLTGYVKGDGNGYAVLKDNGAGGAWFQGTTSTSWQQIGGSAAGVEFVATGATFVAYQYGAGTYSCWIKDLRIELMEARTDNIGSLGGYALLGDGSTPASLPTQLSPKGMAMADANRYLTLPTPTFSSSKDFTLAWFGSLTDMAAITHTVMEVGAYATNGLLLNQLGTTLAFYWNSAGGDIAIATTFAYGEAASYIVSSIAGSVSIYKNGTLISAVTDLSAKAGLSGALSVKVGKGANPGLIGKTYAASLLPFGVSPLQAAYLHNQMMKTLNV